MALVRNQDWLKQAGQEGAGKDGNAEKLWRVGKREKVSFKARKKLIAGERKFFKGWEGIELMTVVEWYVSAKNRRFIGRQFHKLGDELRNEQSGNLSLVGTGERDDQKNEFCREG